MSDFMGYYYGHLRETELKLTWEINQTINTNFDEFGICWVICQYSVHCQLQSNHSPDYLHTFLTLLGLNTHNIINIKRLWKYFCKDINIFISVSFKYYLFWFENSFFRPRSILQITSKDRWMPSWSGVRREDERLLPRIQILIMLKYQR